MLSQLPPTTEVLQQNLPNRQSFSDIEKEVNQTISRVTQEREAKNDELKQMLSDLKNKLDSYPQGITVLLEKTQKSCLDNEKKLETFIELTNNRIDELQKQLTTTPKKVPTNQGLETTKTNFQRRIHTLEKQSTFFKYFSAGTTLALLLLLWNYTRK